MLSMGYNTKVLLWLFAAIRFITGQSSTCGPPTPPYGSTILHPPKQEKYNNGGVVLFGCKQGFYLVGSPLITCTGNTWTQIKFRCLGFCPEIRRILNGKVVHAIPKVGMAAVEFQCNKNHRLIGKHRLECINGRWNGILPFCEKLKSCVRLRAAANGTLHWNDTSHGAKALFACLTGFDLFGSSILTCNNGAWSTSVPSCKAYCMKIRDPFNGRKHGTRFSHGRMVSFECKFGYKLVGSRVLRCIDGRWNSSTPVCNALLCRKPTIPSNSFIIFPGTNKDSYVHGTKLFLACRDGYYLTGLPIMECNQTVWLTMKFSCIASCPVLGTVKNGIITHVTLRDGGEVEIKCLTNYTLDGSSKLICRNGRWNDSLPSCGAPCDEPTAPANGWKLGRDFRHGHSVRFHCSRGHNRVGASSVTCNDGAWDNQAPVCKARCNDPGSPIHGRKRGEVFRHHSWVQFLCDFNFKLDGDEWIQCVDGSWSGSVPLCIGFCKNPGQLRNGKIIGDDYTYGSSVEFRCNRHYRLNGSRFLYCVKGKWNASIPKCWKNCQEPEKPQNGWKLGNNFGHGAVVRFWCKNMTFKLIGVSRITCKNGVWSDPIPSCEARCNDPGLPDKGTKDGDDFRSGANVTFRCNPPFDLVGSHVIFCRNGNWSNSIPTCSKCARSLGVENSNIQDFRITSPDSTDLVHPPNHARLNGPSSWCTSRQTYLQIHLGRTYKVTAIATQGGADLDKWVKRYKIGFYAGATLVTYSESGQLQKTIDGNKDASSIVQNQFQEPFVTKTVQIYPIDPTSTVCLRTEIYGCEPAPDCILVGSMFWGLWSRRGNSNNYYKAYITRINGTHIDFALEVNNALKRSYKRTDPVLIIDKIPEMNDITLNSPVIAVLRPHMPEWYRTGTATVISPRSSSVLVGFDNGQQRQVSLNELRLLKRPRFCTNNT